MRGIKPPIPTTEPLTLRGTYEEKIELHRQLRRLGKDGEYSQSDLLRVGLKHVLALAAKRGGLNKIREEILKERGGALERRKCDGISRLEVI